ncbi:MAG: cobalamin-binding protein [Gammaproteobacteria bacterium]
MKKLFLSSLLAACVGHAGAAITVTDDDGRTVTLAKPAQRVIAMAPHVTELLFAAGGGERIVGAVTYSDYPEAAKRIPNIGTNRQIDLERVIAMKPDLIVVWMHGSSERQVEQLGALGIPMFHSEPRKLDDIPASVAKLGQLLGTTAAANATATDLRRRLATLSARYASRPKVRLFYQVWDKPLYTLNGTHVVSDAVRLCGGENIFADMKVTAPVVSVEAVLQLDPEAIFDTAERSEGSMGVDIWRPYPTMTAVRRGNLFKVDGNLTNRAGPRMIAGTEAICEKLELARQHRPKAR